MTVNKPYYVYVLWSAEGQRHYVGLTENIEHRLRQHNSGESKWTKRYAGSWTLAWSEACENLSSARKLENQLKRAKGGAGFYTRTGLPRLSSGS